MMSDHLPPHLMEVYAAMGMLAAHWASAEYTLDHIILKVHSEYGGDKIEPTMPLSFNRKPTYLRKAYAAHPDLVPHSARLDELLREATDLADLRHWCLHGTMAGIPENDVPFSLARLIRGATPTTDTRPVTARKIEIAAVRTGALSLNLFFFGVESVWIIPKDQADDIVRKIFRKSGTVFPSGKLFG